MFNHLLSDLSAIGDFETRCVTPENLTGGKGGGARTPLSEGTSREAARDLGDGWKVNPKLVLQPGETRTLADVAGAGSIRHIWMTPGSFDWRNLILRFYWDGCEVPSVECPVGDFFASGWGQYAQINSLPVCVNPGRAFNCYWDMPFRRGFKITLENRSDDLQVIFYEITYVFRKMPQNIGYFHAAFNRVNPLPYKEVYTIIDHIEGHGQYVGTVMNWGSNNAGWWGEGEIKFFMDGDRDYPTICGTGTEDYFCGSFAFMRNEDGYIPFATPYSGMPLVIRPDGRYSSQTRFGLYRWHITDPVYFKENLTVTMQALGWRSGGRYLPLQDDISSVAFWYQDQPSLIRRPVGDRDALEII